MDIGAVISQLRTYATALNGNVAGASEFMRGVQDIVNLPLPAAYVVPIDDKAEDNELQNGLRQEVRERIAVIVEIDASADRRGQAAAMDIESLKYAVHSALLNWRIDPIRAQRGLQYTGGHLDMQDRARIFWQMEYELVTTIMDTDGFQVPSTPLQAIDMAVEFSNQTVNSQVTFVGAAIAATVPRPIATVAASAN